MNRTATAASQQSACKLGTGSGRAKGDSSSSPGLPPYAPASCPAAAVQVGRAVCATNVSPTMAVATAPAASPGSVPVTRAGEVCSVTKVSEGRRDGVAGGGNEMVTGPSFLVITNWLPYYCSWILGRVCGVGDGPQGIRHTRQPSTYERAEPSSVLVLLKALFS